MNQVRAIHPTLYNKPFVNGVRNLAYPPFVVVAGLVFLTLVYIALAIMFTPVGAPLFHFTDERGAVTALSAFFLALTSGFSGAAFLLRTRDGQWEHWLWFLVSLGFGFFALDELLCFHEQLGEMMGGFFGSLQGLEGWGQLIILAYGLVGVGTILFFLPEIRRFPGVPVMVTIGFAFYITHILIDSLVMQPSDTTFIIQESAKLYSVEFFAYAMFSALVGTVALRRNF